MNRLNPGYKFLSLLIVSLILSFTYYPALNLTIFGLCVLGVLLTPGTNKPRMLIVLSPFALVAAGLYVSGLLFPAGGEITGGWGEAVVTATSRTAAAQLSSRVLAFGGVGMLFAFTTSAFELVMSLMQQFKVPPKFAYGLLAAYHFLPTIRHEHSIVLAAQKVRGIKPSPLSAKTLLPMLVHAFERAESVAMAMESRGFCDKAPRGRAFPTPVTAADYAFLALCAGGTLAGALLLHG